MIPKVIHYCWFGKNKKPKIVNKCIDSWHKVAPDFEIRCWDENTFDIEMFQYTKEAYQNGKYAFVSDVCRLFVLEQYGGIYLDSDVELIKPLDDIISNNAFIAYLTNNELTTGVMGCEAHHPIIVEELNLYNELHFVNNGILDLTTDVNKISRLFRDKGIILDGKKKNFNGIILYPRDYFSPKDTKTGLINITDNTYAIHHYMCSWTTNRSKINSKIASFYFILKEVMKLKT